MSSINDNNNEEMPNSNINQDDNINEAVAEDVQHANTEGEGPTTSGNSEEQQKFPKVTALAMEALPRLRDELKEIMENPPPNCSAAACGNDIFHWTATIKGPEDTVYEGGNFILDITFPPSYPFRPPRIRFTTRIYHCNIDSRGVICLDVLNEKWTPVLTVSKLLLSIWVLLCECNPDDPLVVSIAEQYKNRRLEFDNAARQCTQKHAILKKENKNEDKGQMETNDSAEQRNTDQTGSEQLNNRQQNIPQMNNEHSEHT